MQKTELKKGINLCTIFDDKFKSFRISVVVYRKLSRQEVTINTLLSAVMGMQCEKYDSYDKISVALEELYGADLILRASKYGEYQVLKYGVGAICDESAMENNFENAANLAFELILNSGKDGCFSKSIVENEKKNIADSIRSQKNDKRVYSLLRLQEEMCKDEPYGINPLGYIEDLEQIDEHKLYNHYKKIFAESRIDIIITGNFDLSEAEKAGKMFARNLPDREVTAATARNAHTAPRVKRISEKMDVLQGKLCMGFRCPENTMTDNYHKAIMYNCIFGGSAVSKLFNNVREKLSLCYYVSSSVDRLKEIMIVRSGVEFANFTKAYNEIMLQHQAILDGDISEEEISAAKKTLCAGYISNYDSIGAMEEYYTMQLILGTDISVEENIKRVNSVTKNDIIGIAKGMVLDTVYCLDRE